MLPKSIRWRLPLSYAGIALLATIALGAVLLITLRGYYALRERDNLMSNAQLISDMVAHAPADDTAQVAVRDQINILSFISQSRIQLFDTSDNLVIDSGDPADKQVTTLPAQPAPAQPDVLYVTKPNPAPILQSGQTFSIARIVQAQSDTPAAAAGGQALGQRPRQFRHLGGRLALWHQPEPRFESRQLVERDGRRPDIRLAASAYGHGGGFERSRLWHGDHRRA